MASIQGVYIALFGRPADPAGLTYFNGVTSNGGNLSAIGDLAGQKEYTDRFSGMSNTGIINAIYHSLFNRDAEPAGLEFFSSALTKGTLTINNIAIAILDGAQGDDKTIVENKLVAADIFTKSLDTAAEQADYSGNAAADAGRAFLTPVGVEKTTIPSQSAIDGAITGIHGGHGGDDTGDNGGVIPGKLDIMLTAGDDAVSTTAMADFKTTNGDDTISATHLTFGTGDTIDGGLGNDTFVLKATGGISIIPELVNVEKIVVTATATSSTSNTPENNVDAFVAIDLDKSAGYKEVWNEDSGASQPSGTGTTQAISSVFFNNIALGTTLGLHGSMSGSTMFSFKDAAGMSDAATLVVDTLDSGSVTVNGIETLTLDVQSQSMLGGNLLAFDAKSILITGHENLSISGITTSADVIDASAHNGKLTLNNIYDGQTVIGGAGDDYFSTYTSGTAGVTLTSGAGADLFNVYDPHNIGGTTNTEVLAGMHVFTDFDGANDILQLNGVSAKVDLTSNQLDDIAAAATLADALKIAGDASAAADSGGLTDAYTTFIYKGDTYVYHDEGHDGFAAQDGLVQLVGFTGVLNSANFHAGTS